MQCYGIRQSIIWLVVGGVLCIVGGIMYIFMPTLVDHILAMELALSKHSTIYPVWQEIPVPIYRKFYLFNYTNAEEVQNDQKITPIVEQCGPYVYRELREKIFIKWNSDGDTAQYRETHTYPFIPELSNGSETDYILSPNLPLATMIDMTTTDATYKQKLTSALRDVDASTFNNIFENRTVRQLLWDGYFNEAVYATSQATGEILPAGMFALFYGKNGTDDCKYEINRGTNDIAQEFEVEKWNETESLPFWDGEYCNMINGSDGTMYNSKYKGGERVYIFISDICRSIHMEYVEEMQYKGYKGHRYASNALLFADPALNPDNACFCNADGSKCVASGLNYFGSCKFNSPLFLSHPHFLWVSKSVSDKIAGLEPHEDRHRSEVNIEPNSGMLLWIDIRFQVNARMQPSKLFSVKIPDLIMPVVWVDETATLDDERMDMLHDSLFLPMNLAYAVPVVVMALGGSAAFVGIVMMVDKLWKIKKEEDAIEKHFERTKNMAYPSGTR